MKNEKATLSDSLKFMAVMHKIATPGEATLEELTEILEVSEKIMKKRVKNKGEEIKNKSERAIEKIEDEIKECLGEEFLEKLKAKVREIEKELDESLKASREEVEKLTDEIVEDFVKSKNLKTFVATFGAGQEHEGKYVKVHTESYNNAVTYMEEKYKGKYCMVYTLEQWENWVKQCKDSGQKVEEKLEELVMMKRD